MIEKKWEFGIRKYGILRKWQALPNLYRNQQKKTDRIIEKKRGNGPKVNNKNIIYFVVTPFGENRILEKTDAAGARFLASLFFFYT